MSESSIEWDGSNELVDKIHEGLLEMMTDIDIALRKGNVNYTLMYGTAIGAVRHKGFIPWDDDIDIAILEDEIDLFEESMKYLPEGKYFLQKPLSIDWANTFYKIKLNGSTAIEEAHLNTRMHQGLFIDVFVLRRCPKPGIRRKLYLGLEIIQRGIRLMTFPTYGKRGFTWLQKLLHFSCKVDLALRRFLAGENSGYIFADEPTGAREIFETEKLKDTMDVEFEGKTFRMFRDYDSLLTYSFGDYMTPPPVEERVFKQHMIAYDRNLDYKDWLAEHHDKK